MLGAVIYEVFYKQTFNVSCAVGILVVVITLVLGLILNKSSKKVTLNQFTNSNNILDNYNYRD